MPGIKDRVAVVGMGCTRFGELFDKSDQDLMVESCHAALEDAKMDLKEIQAAWLGIQGAETGSSGCRLARALKQTIYPSPEWRTTVPRVSKLLEVPLMR